MEEPFPKDRRSFQQAAAAYSSSQKSWALSNTPALGRDRLDGIHQGSPPSLHLQHKAPRSDWSPPAQGRPGTAFLEGCGTRLYWRLLWQEKQSGCCLLLPRTKSVNTLAPSCSAAQASETPSAETCSPALFPGGLVQLLGAPESASSLTWGSGTCPVQGQVLSHRAEPLSTVHVSAGSRSSAGQRLGTILEGTQAPFCWMGPGWKESMSPSLFSKSPMTNVSKVHVRFPSCPFLTHCH